MNYLNDFDKILTGDFFNKNEWAALSDNKTGGATILRERVKEISRLSDSEQALIRKVLKDMTLFNCYKAVLDMKVHFNRVKDSRSSERYYVQARGAVPFEKGKRKWVGQYLGPENDVYNENGAINPNEEARGNYLVRNKVLSLLKNEFGIE
jgi:hypothetical protein